MNRRLVLVVEGDAGMREVQAGSLDLEGCAAAVAWTAEDALRRLALEAPPDAILLNPYTARIDVADFARRNRARPGRHAPVVVLTADRRAEHSAQEARAAAVVVMPFAWTTCSPPWRRCLGVTDEPRAQGCDRAFSLVG
jgi:CheY-like chemotaxis protein